MERTGDTHLATDYLRPVSLRPRESAIVILSICSGRTRTMMAATDGAKFHTEAQLEYIFSYWATLTRPEVIGPVAEGLRLNVYVTDGEVLGPQLHGRLRPVGGDWLLIRTDGVGVLDVRATLELSDGALVHTSYNGVAEVRPDGHARFLASAPPQRIPLRITPRYQTAHPQYLWLNRLQGIGIGEGRPPEHARQLRYLRSSLIKERGCSPDRKRHSGAHRSVMSPHRSVV